MHSIRKNILLIRKHLSLKLKLGDFIKLYCVFPNLSSEILSLQSGRRCWLHLKGNMTIEIRFILLIEHIMLRPNCVKFQKIKSEINFKNIVDIQCLAWKRGTLYHQTETYKRILAVNKGYSHYNPQTQKS